MGKQEPEFCGNRFWNRRQEILDRTRASFGTPKFFRFATITKEVVEAINVAVDYMWYEELEDYFCSAEENHVFVSKLLLRDWLEDQPDFWIETEAVLKWGFAIIAILFFLPEIVWLFQQAALGW